MLFISIIRYGALSITTCLLCVYSFLSLCISSAHTFLCMSCVQFSLIVIVHLLCPYLPVYVMCVQFSLIVYFHRVLSTVHATVVSSMCAYSLVYDDDISKDPIW